MGSKEGRRNFALAFCITLLLAVLVVGCTTACLRMERVLSGERKLAVSVNVALPQEETEGLLKTIGRYGTCLPAAVRFGELAAAGIRYGLRTGAEWAAKSVDFVKTG